MLEVWSSWLNLGHVFAGSAKTMEPVAEPLTKTSGLEGAWCFCDLAGSQLKTLKTARINSMLQTKLQLQPSCPPGFSILPLFIFWMHVIASLRRLGLDAYLLSFQATPVGVFMSCGGVRFFAPINTFPFLTPREEWRVAEGQKPTAVGNLREYLPPGTGCIWKLKLKRHRSIAPYDTWCHSPTNHPGIQGPMFFLKLILKLKRFFCCRKTKRKDTSAPCFFQVATWSASFSSAYPAYLLFYFESI